MDNRSNIYQMIRVKPQVIRLLCKLLVVVMMASCGRLDFKTIETGIPYTGVYHGNDIVVVFDNVTENNASGRLYISTGTLVVEAQPFTSDLNKNGKGTLWIKNEELSLKGFSCKHDKLWGKVGDTSVELMAYHEEDPGFKGMYMHPCHDVVSEPEHRFYARDVKGYWSSYPDTYEDFGTIYKRWACKLVSTKSLDLDMDVYYPKQPTTELRPLLLLIHGGAFYNGDKASTGYSEMGRHFAERGYVVASINYRMGFAPMGAAVDRAGYRALQDAYAAARYLTDNAHEYGIDTTKIFVAGTSAGAIIALNLAFMREKNRPETTREEGVHKWLMAGLSTGLQVATNGIKKFERLVGIDFNYDGLDVYKILGLDTDLGPIERTNGNDYRPLPIKGVVNLWGAVHDLEILANSPQTAILSFHGDSDRIVPYGYGHPFDHMLDSLAGDILDGLIYPLNKVAGRAKDWMSGGNPINEWIFNPMQGSKAIHDKAISMGMHSELYTVAGGGHSLHVNDDGTLSDYFGNTILPVITRFLCGVLVGGETVKVTSDGLWFEATGTANVEDMHWVVDGGVIVRRQGDQRVRVLFFEDARHCSATVCGRYRNGIEFREAIENLQNVSY